MLPRTRAIAVLIARAAAARAEGRAPVGCEACHGPAADCAPEDVMRDTALGLRDLSTPAARAVLCLAGHRESTRLAGFDAEAAWKRIRHGGDVARPSSP